LNNHFDLLTSQLDMHSWQNHVSTRIYPNLDIGLGLFLCLKNNFKII